MNMFDYVKVIFDAAATLGGTEANPLIYFRVPLYNSETTVWFLGGGTVLGFRRVLQ